MKTVTANDTNFTNYEYNSDNQLLYYTTNGSDTISFTYDDNGNQTHIAHSSFPILNKNYHYDYENRLTQITDNTSNVLASYTYGSDWKRLSKTIAEDTITIYFYDRDNVLTEYDNYNNVKVRYTNNLGVDDIISAARNSVTEYYHKDHLGSIINLTDDLQLTTVNYIYDVFGTIINQTGNSENQMTYTGHRYDKKAGLYYYRSRYYNSITGRFTQKDKIGIRGGLNLYLYVKNNPIKFVDSYGNSPVLELTRLISYFKFDLYKFEFYKCIDPQNSCQNCPTSQSPYFKKIMDFKFPVIRKIKIVRETLNMSSAGNIVTQAFQQIISHFSRVANVATHIRNLQNPQYPINLTQTTLFEYNNNFSRNGSIPVFDCDCSNVGKSKFKYIFLKSYSYTFISNWQKII
jgi:RHS repeat-associated protein